MSTLHECHVHVILWHGLICIQIHTRNHQILYHSCKLQLQSMYNELHLRNICWVFRCLILKRKWNSIREYIVLCNVISFSLQFTFLPFFCQDHTLHINISAKWKWYNIRANMDRSKEFRGLLVCYAWGGMGVRVLHMYNFPLGILSCKLVMWLKWASFIPAYIHCT